MSFYRGREEFSFTLPEGGKFFYYVSRGREKNSDTFLFQSLDEVFYFIFKTT